MAFQPMGDSLKPRLAGLLAQPKLMRWAAPVRTLRQVLGWQPTCAPVGKAHRILVIRPDEIGDVILTSPFLRELRCAAPQAKITLLVKSACYELVQHCPYVDFVQTLNFAPHWDKPGYRLRLCWEAFWLRWLKIGWGGFDLILLPRSESDAYDSILVGHLLAGRGAVIVHRTERHETAGVVPPVPPVKFETRLNPVVEHEVLHNLRFLELCGAEGTSDNRLELWLDDGDRKFAAGVLDGCKSWVAIATGAGNPNRCWPVERFAAIAEWLRSEYGLNSVLLGAKGDPFFAATVDLLGKTSLRQAAALMEQCALLVGNDSGLMHLAAAAGIPVVEVSGFRRDADPAHPNSPFRFHAWGVPHRVLQPPPGNGLLAIDEVGDAQVRMACSDLLSLNCPQLA